ncbi:MAG: hypothetical protein IPN00_07760 [Hydrogenophilales bacterium]|jgi:hypothetical protein|nr:hypothetical protein [Hydrogenophilales bacterium]
MNNPSNDAGLIQVLAERLETQRLPRALAIKASVDRGETLGDLDIKFLQEVLRDAGQIAPLLHAHPEWQDLAGRMMQLYKEITEKALANEKRA